MAESYKQGPNKKTDTGVSFYSRLYYEKKAETPTSVTYTFRSGMYITSGQSPEFNGWGSLNYNGSTLTNTGGVKGYSGKYREYISKKTITWSKTASTQTKTITFAARKNSNSSSYQSNGSLSISIPALQTPTISNFTACRDSEDYKKINYSFSVSNPASGKADITLYIDGIEKKKELSLSNGVISGSISLEDSAASVAKSHTVKIKVNDSTYTSLVKESSVITIPAIPAPTVTNVSINRNVNNQNQLDIYYEIAKIKEDQVTVTIKRESSATVDTTNSHTTEINTTKITGNKTINHDTTATIVTVTATGLTGSTSKNYRVSPLFYTMDFGAKGKSIAMGQMANDTVIEQHPNGLFECNMDAWFHNKILGVYPVGSIYMSMNPTNPSEFFGGTWERIGTGRTLVAAGDGDDAIIDENNFTGRGTHTTASTSFPAGELGGELWHKLTAAESGVPAHYHHLNTNGYWALGADSKYSLTNDANGGVSGSGYQVPQIHVSDNAWGRLFDSANNTAANASSSHNIMSSYLAVYMWKRTA